MTAKLLGITLSRMLTDCHGVHNKMLKGTVHLHFKVSRLIQLFSQIS